MRKSNSNVGRFERVSRKETQGVCHENNRADTVASSAFLLYSLSYMLDNRSSEYIGRAKERLTLKGRFYVGSPKNQRFLFTQTRMICTMPAPILIFERKALGD